MHFWFTISLIAWPWLALIISLSLYTFMARVSLISFPVAFVFKRLTILSLNLPTIFLTISGLKYINPSYHYFLSVFWFWCLKLFPHTHSHTHTHTHTHAHSHKHIPTQYTHTHIYFAKSKRKLFFKNYKKQFWLGKFVFFRQAGGFFLRVQLG